MIRPFLSAFILASSLSAHAGWGGALGTGGFLGDRYFGATYLSANKAHNTDISLGSAEGINYSTTFQLNVKYLYSPFLKSSGDISINFAGMGFLLTRCLCEEVFVRNLDIYPEHNYYDETAWRFGLVVAHQIKWRNIEFYWDWVLLDQLGIAAYNNPELRKKPEDYLSVGLGLRIFPDL